MLETLPQIQLTEKAAQAFKQSCQSENHDPTTVYLRVDAISGGCSGYKYGLALNTSEELKPSDVIFSSHQIQVIVDRHKLLELLGPLEIDYADDNLVEQGFVFRQGSGRQCGCGESFTPYQKK